MKYVIIARGEKPNKIYSPVVFPEHIPFASFTDTLENAQVYSAGYVYITGQSISLPEVPVDAIKGPGLFDRDILTALFNDGAIVKFYKKH